MAELMRTWGIAIIAFVLLVLGVIGNVMLDPNLPFIFGIVTGAVLIALLNVFYVYVVKKDRDNEQDDPFQ